jgi:actin-related protein
VGLLSLIAVGRTTGMVIDCGFSTMSTYAAFEGYTISKASQRIPLGALDISEQLNLTL